MNLLRGCFTVSRVIRIMGWTHRWFQEGIWRLLQWPRNERHGIFKITVISNFWVTACSGQWQKEHETFALCVFWEIFSLATKIFPSQRASKIKGDSVVIWWHWFMLFYTTDFSDATKPVELEELRLLNIKDVKPGQEREHFFMLILTEGMWHHGVFCIAHKIW